MMLSAVRFVGHEASSRQQLEVPRDGRPTDRQHVRNLLDRAWAARQQPDDRSALGVAQRVEGVGEWRALLRHTADGNSLVTVTQ